MPLDQLDSQLPQEKAEDYSSRYITYLEEQYQKTLETFSPENRIIKERLISEAFSSLSQRLSSQLDFKEKQKAILRLKLARYFQNNDSIDINTLFDAIIETPKFLNKDEGSLHRLFEIHEQKTLQKIAEMRKQRAEISDKESNPYEALFSTSSDNYYMARLLNMPHLEQESDYMNHCVGASDSYINKIKNGDIEILSFRKTPKINPKTNKLEEDTPVITIEYNLRTKVIEQIKEYNDRLLSTSDPFFQDFIEALKRLKTTRTDTGELRDFVSINSSELRDISVPVFHIFTDKGIISFRDYKDEFILKIGNMPIHPETRKKDVSKIIKIVKHLDYSPDQIALAPEEVTDQTRLYIGSISKEILHNKNIEHIYVRFLHKNEYIYINPFPYEEIKREEITIGGKTKQELEEEMGREGMVIDGYTRDILYNPDITTLSNPKKITLVKISLQDLGFEHNPTLEKIRTRAKELGLEFCPAEVGPHYRLSYKDQSMYEHVYIAMNPTIDSHSFSIIFYVAHHDYGLCLGSSRARPNNNRWDLSDHMMFCLSE